MSAGSHQASLAIPMPQEFVGEYSFDGENWKALDDNTDFSAMDGDMLLRGHFLRDMKAGWQLRFYRNHIGVSIRINGEQVYMDIVDLFVSEAGDLFVEGAEVFTVLVP